MRESRTRRISAEIQKIVSSALLMEVKDPRLPPMITVNRVTTTRDLSYTNIYVSALHLSDEEKKEMIEILNKAKGYIRSLIGAELSVYKIPEPIFIYDDSIEEAMRMNAIIKGLKKEEEDE